MYGCQSLSTDLKGHKQNSLIKTIPYVFSQHCKAVEFDDCKFANEKDKENTARIVVFKELQIPASYTLESTFYGCEALKDNFSLVNSNMITTGRRQRETVIDIQAVME